MKIDKIKLFRKGDDRIICIYGNACEDEIDEYLANLINEFNIHDHINMVKKNVFYDYEKNDFKATLIFDKYLPDTASIIYCMVRSIDMMKQIMFENEESLITKIVKDAIDAQEEHEHKEETVTESAFGLLMKNGFTIDIGFEPED